MVRWFPFAVFALVVGCSGGSNPAANAVPNAPAASGARVGAIGPRLNAKLAHLGRPHYFYNRSSFAAHYARLSSHSPYYYGNGNLQYGGGPVETAPKTYLIFWGFSGPTDATHDPYGISTYLTNFFAALPNSSWLDTVSQYYGTYGGPTAYIANPTEPFTGAYYDAAPPGSKTYTDGQAASEAIKVANIVGYDAQTNYIVVTPHTYTIGGFNDPNGFCAYHSAVTITGGKLLAYTVFPYMPDAGGTCGGGSVTLPGTLDGVSIVSGHEEAEAITDVNAYSGWLDNSAPAMEIADKCAWIHLQNTAFPNGQSYPTQPLWSNRTSSCVQSYPGGSFPTPTPSPSPETSPTPPPPTNVVINPGFETGHLKPWTTCHSKGRMPFAYTSTDSPHSGRYDAYAGTLLRRAEPDGLTSICQLVTIPANGRLSAWTRGVSDDFRSGVYQFARLYTTSGVLVKTLFRVDRNEKRWHEWTIDLSAYANHQYLLTFGIEGKAGARGRRIGQYVDDVNLAR